jgi:hypothetical protein
MRWVNDRSGAAPAEGFVGDWAAEGDMRRDCTHGKEFVIVRRRFFSAIQLDLNLSFSLVGGT